MFNQILECTHDFATLEYGYGRKLVKESQTPRTSTRQTVKATNHTLEACGSYNVEANLLECMFKNPALKYFMAVGSSWEV